MFKSLLSPRHHSSPLKRLFPTALHWAGQLFTLDQTFLQQEQRGGGTIFTSPITTTASSCRNLSSISGFSALYNKFSFCDKFLESAHLIKTSLCLCVSRFAREGLLAKSCPWPGSVNRGEKVVIKLFNGASACPPGRATWIWHVSCGELPITGKQCICRRKHVSVNTKPYISHEQVSLSSFHQESLSTGPQKRKCITKESLSSSVLTGHSTEVMISFRLSLNPVRV